MENEQTDLKTANGALMELKPNVTAQDRKDAPRSEAIIVKYLNGKGSNLDIAMELLKFFKDRIERRRKVLQS